MPETSLGVGAKLHAERMIFFSDAVVAIAMTLLVLPLMESVSEASAAGLTTDEYLAEHSDQLVSFALSFVIIAAFWRTHHRVWERVRYLGGPLFFLNTVWLFAIVWLPVGTALVGQMPFDRIQAVVYIGAMLLMSGSMTLASAYLVRHPELLVEGTRDDMQRGLWISAANATLLSLALALSVAIPRTDNLSLLLLVFASPVAAGLRRVFGDADDAVPVASGG